jgi:hypothetical protein
MSTTTDTLTEAEVLNELVTAEQPGFSPDAARAILSLRFSPAAINRMNELAEKNRQGTLSETERGALEKYLRVGHFLNVVQAKARGCLAAPAGAGN